LGARLLPALVDWGEGIPSLIEATPDDLPTLFVRWDSGYYLHIAENGYGINSNERAFFPLYPLAVYLSHTILGIPKLWGGLFISALAFIGSGLLMYQWVRLDYKHEQALLATTLMYFFPMAFFFVAFYAEPLFLLSGLASVYFARRGWFITSGLAIALAGASRPIAFLLGIPYLLEFWQQRHFNRWTWLRFVLGALIAPTGMLTYLLFLSQQSNSGSFFEAYAGAHADEWLVYHTWPWLVLWDGLKAAVWGIGINQDWFSRVQVWHDLLYAVMSLLVSIWAWPRLRLSAAAFLLIGISYLFTVHGPYGYAFDAKPRQISVLFPIYLAIALLLEQWPERYRWSAIGLSVLMLGLLAAWFTSGRWVS
jgi:Gpi18-like mannosyltransferase